MTPVSGMYAIIMAVFLNGMTYGANPLEVKERLAKLVTRMASANPAPKSGVEPGQMVFDKAWDSEKQRDVHQAIEEVWAIGPEGFPELLKHLEDHRYCCSVDGPILETNLTVGNVCHQIVERWIIGHPIYVNRKAPDCFAGEGLGDWYIKNKDKEWYQLQVMARENAIKYWETQEVRLVADEKAIQSWKSKSPERFADLTDDLYHQRKELAGAVKSLRDEVTELRSTRKPIVPSFHIDIIITPARSHQGQN